MKKFVEKLIGRLEEAGNYHLQLSEENKMDVRESHRHKAFAGVYGNAISIVNELAEEYKGDCCEWEYISSVSHYANIGCKNVERNIKSMRYYTYCPYCGKKIKVLELPEPYKGE